jgi:hypothetical protein
MDSINNPLAQGKISKPPFDSWIITSIFGGGIVPQFFEIAAGIIGMLISYRAAKQEP